MTERKRKAWLIAAALTFLPVFYIACYGPYFAVAVPIRYRADSPLWVRAGDIVFEPARSLAMFGPQPVARLLRGYCALWYEQIHGEPL